MSRRTTPKEKLISSSELKTWVRAHVVPAFQYARKSLPPSLAFSMLTQNGSSVTFLAAIHTQSANIFGARSAFLAVIRASRGRIELIDSSGTLQREDRTIEGWAQDLVEACRMMGVDPAYLSSLSNTFPTLYVS